jgi:polysaccharide export outer membrane protein
MPLVGDIPVAGLTSREAEGAIAAGLRRNNIVNNPQVSVYVKEYTNSEISVVGQVAKPGPYSVLGPHRLFDMLQAAGGLTEKAANQATIAHRGGGNPVTIKLPNNPGEMAQNNIELSPGDTVVVPSAAIVYVLGEVHKPGGYVLNSSGGTTVLRVVAAAGGPTLAAALGGVKMIRRTQNGLEELPVPLKNLLHAKVADIPLEPDDILYVPSSRLKAALNAGALVTMAGSAALYRLPY